MSPDVILNEFFSDSKESDLGFGFWKKPKNYPIGYYQLNSPYFNYFSIKSDKYIKYLNPDFFFRKNRYDSYVIQLPFLSDNYSHIEELKLTNINITDWDDIWENKKGDILDPKIEKLNLSHNLIKSISILDRREKLKEINLSFNKSLVYFNISDSPNLEKVDLSYCFSLDYINLSSSPNIKSISIKNCNCSEQCLESLLRNIRPKYIGDLDITGNSINWNNRNISSKIRLLLANDWKIKWDSNPPDSIIPFGYWKKFDPLLLDRNFK